MYLANKAFKSDSQRLAVSLRSSIAKRRSHLNAALGCFKSLQFLLLYSATSNLSLLLVSAAMWLKLFQVKASFNWPSFDVSD
ncbi:hypothetical protein CTT30_06345 [Vibrio coralliilyticus]|nr:hypothetical protein CTT30_06345 [Vibrio coralliilyticus]